MPFVKICGIQTTAEATAALACGATAVGFLVGLTHRAADGIAAETARSIVARLPPDTNTVLVTHLLDVRRIADLATYVGARTIQVHDDVPPAELPALRALAPGKIILKAVHVTGPDAIDRARAYRPLVDALLLDSRTTDRLGGTGQTHDWSISAQIVADTAGCLVYLAGGLTPENVARAIAEVRPAGVDVNSGVEDGAGEKDPARLAAFVAAALAALGRPKSLHR